MPKIFPLGNFNSRTRGAEQLDAGFIALALGPKCLTDAVLIGGRILRAGQVLPVSENARPLVEQFRGWRHGTGFVTEDEVVNDVEILAWTAEEASQVQPFARSPAYAYQRTNYVAAAAAARTQRLAFQGRRMAQFAFWSEGATLDASFELYGVKYRPRPLITASTNHVGYTLLQATTVIPRSTTLGGGVSAAVGYIGGTDSAEHFDEIEAWLTLTGAGDINVTIIAEAWGENYDGGG